MKNSGGSLVDGYGLKHPSTNQASACDLKQSLALHCQHQVCGDCRRSSAIT